MVRATVIIINDPDTPDVDYYSDEDMNVICPFCDSVLDINSIFYNDYVSDNWAYFCNCGEGHLICRYLETESDDCSIKMDPEEVKAICEKYKLGYEKYYRGYQMGVLKLNFVLPDEQMPDINECNYAGVYAAYIDKSNTYGFHLDECFSLNEAREEIGNCLSHDGKYVGYVGECTECGQEYSAVIWGD